MENRSVLDEFSKGFAGAIADTREKVVEEPMYGRALTNHHDEPAPRWPQARKAEPAQSAEQERERNVADHDIDR